MRWANAAASQRSRNLRRVRVQIKSWLKRELSVSIEVKLSIRNFHIMISKENSPGGSVVVESRGESGGMQPRKSRARVLTTEGK